MMDFTQVSWAAADAREWAERLTKLDNDLHMLPERLYGEDEAALEAALQKVEKTGDVTWALEELEGIVKKYLR